MQRRISVNIAGVPVMANTIAWLTGKHTVKLLGKHALSVVSRTITHQFAGLPRSKRTEQRTTRRQSLPL